MHRVRMGLKAPTDLNRASTSIGCSQYRFARTGDKGRVEALTLACLLGHFPRQVGPPDRLLHLGLGVPFGENPGGSKGKPRPEIKAPCPAIAVSRCMVEFVSCI